MRDTFSLWRAKRCRAPRRGEAHRRPPLCGGGVGWRGGPLRTINGADIGFRRTLCLHPRRAKRRAQVCGEVTVKGEGQGKQQIRRPGWHLIHRGAVPLPLVGEGLRAVKVGRDCECRARHFHIAASIALSLCHFAKGCSYFRAPAGRSPSPAGVGWRGLPLRTITGADSGFRRTACLHPRRAQRKDQVCGEVTVGSVGQGNQQSPAPRLAPHPPRSGPPSPRRGRLKHGRNWGLTANVGHDTSTFYTLLHIGLMTLLEGELVRSSPHPPRSGPPSPKRKSGE